MKKILVIEPRIFLSKVLRLYLQNQDFEVQNKEFYADGLEALSQFKPNAIILDVSPTYPESLEFCLKMKNLEQAPQIAFIIITAHPEYQLFSSQLGADLCLVNPMRLNKLAEKINELILERLWFPSIKPLEAQDLA
jgi:DNA-binding response OmpR family regulator